MLWNRLFIQMKHEMLLIMAKWKLITQTALVSVINITIGIGPCTNNMWFESFMREIIIYKSSNVMQLFKN